MLRCLYMAAVIVVVATSGSATASAQYISSAEIAKTVRNWGPETNGLALSISVDKTPYVFGDPIPLHIAFRNIRANEAVTLPFCTHVELMVHNTKGEEFVPHDPDISCNFSGPIRTCGPGLAPGDIVASQIYLADYRLPLGTYTVSGEWTAFAYLKAPNAQACPEPSGTQPFYVHSNTVTIRIVAPEQP